MTSEKFCLPWKIRWPGAWRSLGFSLIPKSLQESGTKLGWNDLSDFEAIHFLLSSAARRSPQALSGCETGCPRADGHDTPSNCRLAIVGDWETEKVIRHNDLCQQRNVLLILHDIELDNFPQRGRETATR